MIALRKTLLLSSVFLLISCATQSSLRITDVRKCLTEDANINAVTSCIQPFAYQSKRSEGLPAHALEDFCPDPAYKNCSRADLLARLNTGSTNIIIQPGEKKHSQVHIIRDPYVLFYSDAQNLGGSLVMLYVFYVQSDGRVIGWINLGSGLDKFDFRATK